MGTALLILVEILVWGIAVVLVGGLFEAAVSAVQRRRKQTVR